MTETKGHGLVPDSSSATYHRAVEWAVDLLGQRALTDDWTRGAQVWNLEDRDKLKLLVYSIKGETVDKLRLYLVELHEAEGDTSGIHQCIFGSVLEGIQYLCGSYEASIQYHLAQDGLLEKAQQETKKLADELAEIRRPLDQQMARLNEQLIVANDRAIGAKRKLELLSTPAQQILEVLDNRPTLARLLNYPQSWDTAAYPKLDDALYEVCMAFNCQGGATAIDRMLSHAGNLLARECYRRSKEAGWWTAADGSDLHSNPLMFPAQLMLCVTELAEACEGDRTGIADNHLPQYPMAAVEVADAVARVCLVAGAWGWPLGDIIVAKAEYNKTRPDHALQARSSQGGKKY